MTDEDGTALNLQDDHFMRTGFFASAYWRDLNVFGAYVHGKDTLRQFDPRLRRLPGRDRADLQRGSSRPTTSSTPGCTGPPATRPSPPATGRVPSLRTGVFNVSGLIRANIKAILEYQRDLREAKNHSLDVVLRFAF